MTTTGDAGTALTPQLVYMWIKVLGDGKTAIPQYDPLTGREVSWAEAVPAMEISRLMWGPIPIEVESRVKGVMSVPVPPISFNVENVDMDDVLFARRGYVTSMTFYHCEICDTTFQWLDTTLPIHVVEGPLQCPNCMAKNEWHCDICDEIKDNPIFLKNNEVRCPDCEKIDPRGLTKIENLRFGAVDTLTTHYVLGIKDKWGIELVEGPEAKSGTDWKLIALSHPTGLVSVEDTEILVDGAVCAINAGEIMLLGEHVLEVPHKFRIWVTGALIRVEDIHG